MRVAIPVLRIFDVSKALEFYVDWLGFEVDWAHPNLEESPVYIQIARDQVVLHLSEHYGDCCPGSLVNIYTPNLEGYLEELKSQPYTYYNPSIDVTPWNLKQIMITDPFGNRLNFNERTSEDAQ